MQGIPPKFIANVFHGHTVTVIGQDEMQALFRDLPHAVSNAWELANALDFTLADLGYQFPDYPLPAGETPSSFLRKIAWNGARTRFRPLTARAFLREVERNGHGSLVLVGSTAGIFGEAGHADYAAAKSAIVQGLLLSLKNEVVRASPRARVNAVCPGWTYSPMTRGEVDDEVLDRVTATMPLRKIAQPEDVARQVAVLASDELSGHVTGQVVVIAGGMEGRLLHPK